MSEKQDMVHIVTDWRDGVFSYREARVTDRVEDMASVPRSTFDLWCKTSDMYATMQSQIRVVDNEIQERIGVCPAP